MGERPESDQLPASAYRRTWAPGPGPARLFDPKSKAARTGPKAVQVGMRHSASPRPEENTAMNQIVYIVGAVVIVLAVFAVLGLR